MRSANNVDAVLSVIPPFEGKEMIIEKHHSANQIVAEVLDAHNYFASDYDLILKNLSFSRDVPIEDQLFDFCKKNLKYVEEKGAYQSTRSPAGIIELGSRGVGVDCKHYAGYIAGCLDAWNRKHKSDSFDWCYRFASYDNNPQPGHVFVVVKDDDDEIWIDPVLMWLDQRYPFPRFHSDKKPSKMLSRLSGIDKKKIGCNCGGNCGVGATVIQATSASGTTGQTKLLTAASAIEVVGTALDATVVGSIAGVIVNAVGAVVAAYAKFFGNKWHDNNEVRWLIQMYEYYVLGNEAVTSDNDVDESLLQDAYNWYFAVLGVPVYDRNTIAILAGNLAANMKLDPGNFSPAERAARYLSYPQIAKLASDVTINQAEAGAILAKQELQVYTDAAQTQHAPPGYWASLPLAQYWIDIANAQSSSLQTVVNNQNIISQCGAGLQGLVCWAKANPVKAAVVGVAASALIIGLFTPSKNSANV